MTAKSPYDAYADLVAERGLAVTAGGNYAILATTEARPLVAALERAIWERGGVPHLMLRFPESDEIRFRCAGEEQLGSTSIVDVLIAERADGILLIHSDGNPAANAAVPMARQMIAVAAQRGPMQTVFRRVMDGSLRWSSCVYPGRGYAQLAGMGERAYEELVLKAVKVDEPDPVEAWRGVERAQQEMIESLTDGETVRITGDETDLTLSVKGRRWINAAGRSNMPDGEIYTGPVESSLNGHIHFRHPIMYKGNVAEHVRLQFEDGRCVAATASRGEDFLRAMIALDEGSAYCGEFAIGTNVGITAPTGHILLDEKMAGTVHLALGNGYPATGSRNVSAVHWDFICDLRTGGRVQIDGTTVLEDGVLRPA